MAGNLVMAGALVFMLAGGIGAFLLMGWLTLNVAPYPILWAMLVGAAYAGIMVLFEKLGMR